MPDRSRPIVYPRHSPWWAKVLWAVLLIYLAGVALTPVLLSSMNWK